MAFKNYTISSSGSSPKLAFILVVGLIIVMTALGVTMFYIGRQSVFVHYKVTPVSPR